jgi:DNA-binding transcriptional LysR family regulator
MAVAEWLRTFMAVYRSGSVTDGARLRSISQSAASQQLAQLARRAGGPLFVRTREGFRPTEMGVRLYGDISSALDSLETVLNDFEAGRFEQSQPALRVGAGVEYLSAVVLPKIAATDLAVVAHFGDDSELLGLLARGELDVALTKAVPPHQATLSIPVGADRFVLVASPGLLAGARLNSLDEVGDWLSSRPWVAYNLELPATRRFWQQHLKTPFSAPLRLVAPDLRVVLSAVERGVGCSILPTFLCEEPLGTGAILEVYPISELIPPAELFVNYRQGEATRPSIARFVELMLAQ